MIRCCRGLFNSPLRVLGVRHGVTNDILKEDLQDTTSLLVDEAGDTLDTTTTGETPDSLNIRRVKFKHHDAPDTSHIRAW